MMNSKLLTDSELYYPNVEHFNLFYSLEKFLSLLILLEYMYT